MPKFEDVVVEARTWVGTPYHHQQCVKGHGVDCAQLVAGVGHALGLLPVLPRQYVRYSRTPNPRQMQSVLELFMNPLPAGAEQFGDVAWMCWQEGLPQHLGIYSDSHGGGIIHALASEGKVVETDLDNWTRKMIHGWWRYRGLNGGR
jgi:cell wall-associated NlpC family hydrolase